MAKRAEQRTRAELRIKLSQCEDAIFKSAETRVMELVRKYAEFLDARARALHIDLVFGTIEMDLATYLDTNPGLNANDIRDLTQAGWEHSTLDDFD